MLKSVALVLVISAANAILGLVGPADDQPPAGPHVRCLLVQCAVEASDPGDPDIRPTAAPVASTTSSDVPSGDDKTDADSSTVDPCPWSTVENLHPDSSWWGGNDPSAGHVELNKCSLGNPNVPGSSVLQVRFVSNAGPAGPAAPPPPTPEQLAQRAIAQLVVPAPTVGVGPDRAKLAVNLWNWLWVDDAPPVSVTVAAGNVSVTATATLTSTTWSLGEPAAGDVYVPGAPTTLTCQGPGAPPPVEYDWRTEPPCGHKFAWRSLKERTGGSGKWSVTATTNWTVAWQSNTGVSGADALTATTADQWDVGEYRTVLVQGSGG
jgi:hypothetical protein